MIEKLRNINEIMIKRYENDVINLKRYVIIKKILEDKYCFFKMDVEYAYSILRDLEIEKDDLIDVYCQLLNI